MAPEWDDDDGWDRRRHREDRDEGRMHHVNWRGNDDGPLVQVARMGNPLVNELIINTPQKDKWNATEPEDEAQFEGFYKNPVIATALVLCLQGAHPALQRFAGETIAPT